MKEFTVDPHEDGVKLQRWLKSHFPHITRGLLEKGIRKGWVKLDGKKPKANSELNEGQIVSLAEYLCDASAHTYEDAPTPKVNRLLHMENDQIRFREMIIFENDELIAINKPAGLAVQGGSGQKTSVDSMAQSIADEHMRPRLVHRLDKDTSGILIMAKTSRSATRLTKLFASKDIEKKYTALLVGVPKVRKGKVDLPMIKSVKAGHTHVEDVQIDLEEGKDAVTLYEVTSTAATKYAWVDLYPITGRTHQLRVHMAAIHHPIVGDGKYGGAEAFQAGSNLAKQLHLHAASITIPLIDKAEMGKAGPHVRVIDDDGDKKLVIEAPLPEHMQHAWEWTGS